MILKAMLFCSVNINRRGFFCPTGQISWAGVGKGKGEISPGFWSGFLARHVHFLGREL